MKWEKKKLCECTEYITDGDHQPAPKADKGVHFIKIKDIVNNQVSFDAQVYVPQEYYDNLPMERKPQKEDVLYTVVGSFGIPSYVQTDELFCFERNIALLHPNKDIEPRFLYYSLKNPAFYKGIEIVANGSAQKLIPLSKLKDLKISVPDKEAQRHIADILSAYDDLIENNQRQIKLLEEAAQRLYKEWFVDLRFPGHENTKIVDGVPEGWRVASIADICDTVGGGTPSTKIQSYYEKGDILWVTPTDITRNFSLALLDTEKKITPEGLKNSSAKMLPAETILMTSRASVGFFGMCKYEVCTNQGFISCIPKRENLQMYLLFNLKSRVEEIRQKAGGSTYLEISKTVFRELKIILPKDEVLAEYQKNVHDIFDEIYCRTEMIKSLVDMRNRLLPKLMSGEVEV